MSTHSLTSTEPRPNSTDGEQCPQPRSEWDELAELAAMTGYTPEPPPGKVKSHAATSKQVETAQDQESDNPDMPLLDQEDLEESEADTRTKTPLWSNPLAKGIFVSALIGLGIGAVGLFIGSLNSGWNQKLAQPNPVVTPPAPEVDPDQAEIGRLKTVNALGSQSQLLQQPPAPPAPQSAPPAPPTSTRPARTTSAPSARTSPPPPVYTPRRAAIAPAAASMQRMAPRPAAPIPAVNPTEAWQNSVEMGSFGEGEVQIASEPVTPLPNEAIASSDSSMQALAPQGDARYQADVAALLSGIPRRTLMLTPGTTTDATLTTPVFWAQDLDAEQQPQRFGLQLSEPLYAADSAVALPAGTEMIARVDAISESGMVQLSVVAVITPSSDGNQVIEIPPGVLLIGGEGGEPLVAENRNPDRERIADMDLNLALMSALNQVGGLLNRPDHQTTTTSPYLSTTSVRNGDTNIVGGIMQGAFDSLLEETQERQQQEIEEILQRPHLWYIPSGEPLQILINSSLELSL